MNCCPTSISVLKTHLLEWCEPLVKLRTGITGHVSLPIRPPANSCKFIILSLALFITGCSNPTYYPGIYIAPKPLLSYPAENGTQYNAGADMSQGSMFYTNDDEWSRVARMHVYRSDTHKFLRYSVGLFRYAGNYHVELDSYRQGNHPFQGYGLDGELNVMLPFKMMRMGIGLYSAGYFEYGPYPDFIKAAEAADLIDFIEFPILQNYSYFIELGQPTRGEIHLESGFGVPGGLHFNLGFTRRDLTVWANLVHYEEAPGFSMGITFRF